ncbi:MAG: sigma-70 family RNA polymerase sigma factor [Planctomycetes bacterium]|nr:sigma-70 family RNA polymerase sigma factor [Planctomycetota bacterium]
MTARPEPLASAPSEPQAAAPAAAELASIDRARGGCTVAQAALWSQHRGWVAGLLLAHAPRGADLEDLLQEVALRFVRAIDTLERPDCLVSWLRRIALHSARSAGRRASLVARIRLDAAPGDAAEQWPDPRADARRAQGEELDEVLAAMRRLPVALREVLVLRCMNGLTPADVALRAGCTAGAVESRLARARRALRAELRRRAGRTADRDRDLTRTPSAEEIRR